MVLPNGLNKCMDSLPEFKEKQMLSLAEYRERLYHNPVLKFLFLELTLRCNEHCLHCGSLCGDVPSEELSFGQYRKILDDIKKDFNIRDFMLCITGGEPLLRKDFFDILGYANQSGYTWGMTSNATLINAEAAHRLRLCGMKTISVSIDGLRQSHDAFRQTNGGYDKAMRGIEALISEGGFKHIQVTSVMNHGNIRELEEMYRIFEDMDIDSWRVIGIEPMGRALDNPDLLLTDDDQRYLFDFIREKRMENMPVTYGCSHFLGYRYEREVRERYFLCNAGIYTASICCNGDIIACLDIERRPEFVQGNILNDSFKEVWNNRFSCFRQNLALSNETCSSCEYMQVCAGGSHHSYDYDKNRQRICFRNVLF